MVPPDEAVTSDAYFGMPVKHLLSLSHPGVSAKRVIFCRALVSPSMGFPRFIQDTEAIGSGFRCVLPASFSSAHAPSNQGQIVKRTLFVKSVGLCHSLPEVLYIPVNQKKCKLKNNGVFRHANYVEAISKPRLRPYSGVARLLKMLIRLRWTPLSRRHTP